MQDNNFQTRLTAFNLGATNMGRLNPGDVFSLWGSRFQFVCVTPNVEITDAGYSAWRLPEMETYWISAGTRVRVVKRAK